MCGIAGIFSNEHGRGPARDDLVRMARSMAHRGPDSEGIHVRGPVGLSFRRLSIIDRSGGDQPIFNADGSMAIIFNGEAYNHLDLRRELEARGHRFKTRSDTETVLLGYQEWGARGICERLRGMYAFAIDDARNRRLIVARDRLGKKPVHVARYGGQVRFASELKTLLADPAMPRRVSARALLDYATLGYVPGPDCIFEGVTKLPPAHVLTIEWGDGASGHRERVERYWDASFAQREIGLEAAAERVLSLVEESVRIRLMSEVPLGCFLSGGIDSSAIVAAMARTSESAVKAVTVGFDDARFDERGAAAEVARHLGITPSVEMVRQDPDVLTGVGATFDEPHADPSDLPTWLLCRATRRHVTVALSGDGGDELFGGYRRYRFDLIENRVRSLVPGVVRRLVFGPLGRALPKGDRLPRPLRAKTLIANLARDPIDAYFRSVARVAPEDALRLLDRRLREELRDYRPVDRFRAIDARRGLRDPLARIRAIDLETWLPDDILAKVDLASMAHSLEVRAPLLDQELVEFASTLPSDLLIHGGRGKRVFKHALARWLPVATIERKKHGFDLPVRQWLAGPLAATLDSFARPGSALDGWFDAAAVNEVIAEHRSGRRDRSAELWMLTTFARWRTMHLDRAAT